MFYSPTKYANRFLFLKQHMLIINSCKMDMFSWFYTLSSKRQLRIVTLVSKTQYERQKYVLSFDVIRNTDFGKIKEIRQKEDQVYEELPCIGASCSGDIEMVLSGKKCHFTMTVSGALTPASQLQKGEDILEYNDCHLMSESRRHLHLIPTYDDASRGLAFIKFWDGDRVKHTVTICDVPVTAMSSASLPDTRISSASLSTHLSDASLSSQTARKYVDYGDSVDSGLYATTLKTATLRDAGYPMSTAENQALPVSPNSTSGPTCVGSGSGDANEVPDQTAGDETGYNKILSHTSLHCLSSLLSPQDGNKLLINLGVPPHVIDQKKKDHPGDIVSATFNCLLTWKSEKKKSSESNQDTKKHMYEDLLKQLNAAGRNDIRLIIKKVFAKNRELEQNDFKHM